MSAVLERVCASGKERGTCDEPACGSHRRCHCGCGGETPVYPRRSSMFERTAGMPGMYLQGHHPNTQAVAHSVGWQNAEASHQNDVDVADLGHELAALLDHYGKPTFVARAAGIEAQVMTRIYSGYRRKMRRSTAEKVRRAFAAIDRPRGPALPVAPVVGPLAAMEGALAERLGETASRRYHRALKRTAGEHSGIFGSIPLELADTIATRGLRRHPVDIWGERFFE